MRTHEPIKRDSPFVAIDSPPTNSDKSRVSREGTVNREARKVRCSKIQPWHPTIADELCNCTSGDLLFHRDYIHYTVTMR
ncbi:unnamed protein product [Dicrocoelium dendriticum]|nr:unnamed protein product [Dicrocoelium dendriticum]